MLQEIRSYLPLISVIIPFFSFIMVLCAPRAAWWRHSWSLVGSSGALISAVLMYPLVADGNLLIFDLPMIVSPFGLTFRVDFFSFLFAAIISFIWLMATVFAIKYMEHEQNRGRFFAFFLLTLTGTMGVPLAGDLLTLLLFFELMSLASYVLVIHTQTDEAYRSGNLYLYLGVFGGMCLLTGIGLIYFNCGLTLNLDQQICMSDSNNLYAIIAGILLITGFGIKAGMFPLHIWLPKAHPVAPAPASALLSGIMIKAGAYGMIRTVNMIYTPENKTFMEGEPLLAAPELWNLLADMGFTIIWIGIITMFFGAFMALLQDNIKKLLACSSISQIGYIIMGIGAAAYLGYDGAISLAGSTYHILNHAFFKSTLFLAAGAIVFSSGELRLSKLGNLKHTMPFTTAVVLIATLGIVGMPLFNGYASKTLLHHAIVEAYEHHHLISLSIAEKIFTITSAGTVCYFIKFLYYVFWRPAPIDGPAIKPEPLLMKISLGILGISMLLIGTSPNFILGTLIQPALGTFNFDPHSVEHLNELTFWHWGDISAVLIALVLGSFFYFAAHRSGFYNTKIPFYFGADFIGSIVGRSLILLWMIISYPFALLKDLMSRISSFFYRKVFVLLQSVDYRPGQNALFRSINISNIDFDMLLILLSFSLILIVVFYIRFGLDVFRF